MTMTHNFEVLQQCSLHTWCEILTQDYLGSTQEQLGALGSLGAETQSPEHSCHQQTSKAA